MDKEEKNLTLKIEEIIIESKKYNLIDRFYHLNIESNKLYKYINSLEADFYKKMSYIGYITLIQNEIDELIDKIKNCYGIWNPKFHLETQRTLFLDNPNLLGISPFLFDQEDWRKIILNEIEKLKYIEKHTNPIFWIIDGCLKDTFYRLQINEFSELQGITHFYKGWDESIKTSIDVFSLIVDECFDIGKNSEEQIASKKYSQEFVENQILDQSITSKLKINTTFEVADKVFKKYFELNFKKERFLSLYPNFRFFLQILCNKKNSIQNKPKSIGLSQEEVKKLIGFFSSYKSINTSDNIFTYEVKQLIELLEQISGLEANTTWEKSHRDIKYKIDNTLLREINSIIFRKVP
ncbi:hypothetical protein NO004_560093 [Flavobacterium psychrophilum]|nr:hypothetical protein NO004_560093 [Flavobacterium psychrophilum]